MRKPVLNMIDTPIHSKWKKSYNFRVRQEFCQPQIGRKVRIFTYLFARKKHNDIHTDMQYIIKMLSKDERDVNCK